MSQVDNRPRSHSVLSSETVKTHKSWRSNSSNKLDLTESSKDKQRLHGKTDPSMAINEAQPAAQALEKPTLENLRRLSYSDRSGQHIHEPDASNPTRSKWESPLATIRAFEEDVDRTYREKRASNYDQSRPQSRGDMFSRAQSRRSSYFGGLNNTQSMVGGYYRGQGQENEDPHNHQDQYNGPGPNGYGQNGYGGGRNGPRMNRGGISEPMMSGGPVQSIQPPYHQYHNSRETVNASPETDQSGQTYSTNPSSYNNSNDQLGQMGMQGMPGMQNGMGYPKPMAPNHAAVPRAQEPPRAPMKLDTGVDNSGGGDMSFREGGQKKQSWLKKRFSKN